MAQNGLETINLVLSNMYGPGDHFEESRSHALGALIMKFARAIAAKEDHVIVWGSGSPIREWLYVDDAVQAILLAMNISAEMEIINVGIGQGISITDLAKKISDIYVFKGRILFDTSKPDGAPHKTVDGTRGSQILGWKPEIDLDVGIKRTIEWYEESNNV